MWSWLAVSLSGIGAIAGAKHGHVTQTLIYKVFTFVLLATIALSQPEITTYSYWIVGGLVVSALADILHTLSKRKPLHFICFLVAQLCYSKAFWLQLSGQVVWWLFALLLAACVVAFFLLLPRLDKLVFPVVIMGMMLLQLNWAAGEVWLLTGAWASLLGFLGTLTLTLSAGLLAVHDYRHSIRYGRYLISGSYLLAHSLITASLII